jgi:YD repeat-containing protein
VAGQSVGLLKDNVSGEEIAQLSNTLPSLSDHRPEQCRLESAVPGERAGEDVRPGPFAEVEDPKEVELLGPALGTAHLSCSYSGDSNYSQSRSSTLTQTVNKASPNLLLSSNPISSSVFGQPVALMASNSPVSSGLQNPTGTVTFDDGGSSIGSAALALTRFTGITANAATLMLSNLAVGAHTFTASYPGDGNYNSEALGPNTFSVNKASTTTSLSSSINPSALCQSVAFTTKVSPSSPGAGTPTGSVVFLVNGSPMATITLSNGVASWSSSSLSQGSQTIGANYQGDGNFNTSNTILSQGVNAAVNWPVTAAAAVHDPQQGAIVPFGTAKVQPLTGALVRELPLDINQHADCDCGCGCDDNNRAGTAPLGVVYNSGTVNVQPVIVAQLASDFCAAVPSQIQAQLTWNSVAQGTETWATTGHSSGDVYQLPLQVGSAVASSGIYPWSVTVAATVGTFVYGGTVSGVLPVVVNNAGALGAGCALGGTQALLIGSAGVALVDNATGGTRYFSGTGPSYTSPANDQGTLVQNMGGGYTYTSKEQLQTNFDSSGRMISQVDPHGLTQTLTWSAGLIQTITQPDGAVATLGYNGANQVVSIQAAGGRTTTIGYDGSGNMNSYIDAANGTWTLSYSSHQLANEQVGPMNTSYSYASNGTLNQINQGLGTTLSVTAAVAQGLGASTAINTSAGGAALTDARSNTTTYLLDALGRPTQVQTADGGVQSWTLNVAGNPTVYVDQLNRVTSYAFNSTQDLTGIIYADGTMSTMQYELTFHQMTQREDALGHFTTWSYSSTTSDLLTIKDALGNVTTNTWSNGMLQTVTDALGRVTTYLLDTSKRRNTGMIDALGNITSYAFDGAGNKTSIEDALGHFTTWSYDGMRRVLTRTNALLGVQTSTWDALGNLLTSEDELGRTTSNTFDQRSLLVSTMEAVGTAQQRTTTNAYDVAGNLSYVTDALAEITSYGYDVLNRVVSRIEAFGSSVQRTSTTVFDLAGNVISTIDPLGTITSYVYDLLNRQTQMIEASGNALQRTTSTIYDAVGNVLSVTNPRGTVASYGYNANNWRTQVIEGYGTSLSRTTTNLFDNVGNTLSITNPIGVFTSYAFDALNRIGVGQKPGHFVGQNVGLVPPEHGFATSSLPL